MSSRDTDRSRRKSAIALAALLMLGAATVPVSAQTSTLPDHTATRDIAPDSAAAERLGAPLDRPLAAAIEKRVVSGKVDKEIEGEFGPGVSRAVRHAYASRLFAPVWTEAGARAFREETRHLFEHGIVADDVFEADLDDLIDARFSERSAKRRAKADTRLTLAALRAAQAVSGELTDEGGRDLDAGAPKRSRLTDFIVASGTGNFGDELSALAPRHPQYGKLQDAMAHYRKLKREGGWAAIPDGDLIEEGDTDPRVSALRLRLAAEGFDSTADASDPDLMNASTLAALKAFQRRHGLEDDGVVGGNTLEALNESVESKVARIAESMHRWRAHGDLGERYVLANIPSYTAEGWNDGVREISMRTVVGKPQHATPVFSDTVEYVVANPKWYVPRSIARRQKLSKLRADPSYAPRKGYQVVSLDTGQAVSSASVDWNDPDVLSRYRLVQQPGDNNALGELKIIFPNQYSVYLHGTPTMHLFDEAQRAFSSGCVRLEDPEAMARWIAEGDPELTPSDISEQLDSGERERMNLNERIPVHITYITVTVNDAGEPVFHRDVYDRLDEIETVKRVAALSGGPRERSAAP